jgi:uncharacterized protein
MVDEVSNLCVSCGLCCNGTLFSRVKISLEESIRLKGLGIDVLEKKHAMFMSIPCGKLKGSCCTVYENRPNGCQVFFCSLADKLKRKEVTFESARQSIEELQLEIEELKRLNGKLESVRQIRESLGDSTRAMSQALIVQLKKVDALIQKTLVN